MALQLSQTPQGSTVGPPLPSDPTQLSARAMMRAVVVLPTQGAHHRFLADQGGEVDGTVFAGEDAIGKSRSACALGLGAPRLGALWGLRHGCLPVICRGPVRPGGRRARAARPPRRRAAERVRDRHDPKRIRYGCFLPDLTGLATAPPTPAPRGGYIRSRTVRRKGRSGPFAARVQALDPASESAPGRRGIAAARGLCLVSSQSGHRACRRPAEWVPLMHVPIP